MPNIIGEVGITARIWDTFQGCQQGGKKGVRLGWGGLLSVAKPHELERHRRDEKDLRQAYGPLDVGHIK